MVLALALALLWRHGKPCSQSVIPLLLCVGLSGAACGLVRVEVADWSFADSTLQSAVGTEVDLIGTIVRDPEVRERTQHLYVQIDEVDEIILVYTDRHGSYAYGDHVTVSGEVRAPTAFATEFGRTFDYPGYLRARGVQYVMSFATITVTDSGGGNPVISRLLGVKHAFMRQLERVMPEPQVGLGEGLLLGVKQALGDELERIFRQTGIIHIVVLSGYNIALVVIFVRYLLSFLFPYRLQLVVGVLAIVAFALMVGLSATVVRASLMASFILFAKFIGRTYAVIRGLFVAGVIMLLVNPYLLVYDVGFQLSFVATLGLILLAPQLERWFLWVPTIAGIREVLLATLSTQLFVLPILLYQIGEFSVVSVLVNVLVLPMVPVAMLLTLATGLMGALSVTAALALTYPTSWSLSYIIEVARWFAALPFAAYIVPAFSFWWVIGLYVALGYGLWRLMSPVRTTTDPFAEWTIEDEAVLKQRLQENSQYKRSQSTPPFFT